MEVTFVPFYFDGCGRIKPTSSSAFNKENIFMILTRTFRIGLHGDI